MIPTAENIISIDASTCRSCGLCGAICPRHVTEVVKNEGGKKTTVVSERADLCLRCGHCAAVCPTDSIEIDGQEEDAFRVLSEMNVTETQLLTLLRQRRSVRRYKQRAVPRDMLERLIEAAHAAPTGTGRTTTSLLVLDNRSRIDAMMQIVFEGYAKLEKALRNPVARYFVRRHAGRKRLSTLDDFVMPGMRWSLKWYREGIGDEISRDCPAMLLFHGPANEPQMNDNCTIAAFHVILMAETLGLGTCFNHLIPPVINRSKALREMLGIQKQNDTFTAITLGFPKFKWKRAVAHRLAEVRFID